MKALIIARVSTEEQREAGNSLPAQLERMRSYCKRNSFQVVDEFSFDESAYKEKRDEFEKILNTIEELTKKEKVAVCFDKVDRLSRNIFDKRVAKLQEMTELGKIELHFVSDGQILNNQVSATQKFQFGMNLSLAKYYSDAISDNTKRTLEQRRRDGKYNGKAPPGYKNVRNENDEPTIVINNFVKHFIKEMFELYATGLHSYFSISKIMYDKGYRTTSGLKAGGTHIENILKNPFYYGHPRSPKHGMYGKYHEYGNIINKELFDKVQEIRKKKQKGVYKSVSEPFIFKGLLKCQNCGCAITPERKIKKSGLIFIYYSCTNYKKTCKRYFVNEKALLEPILADLNRLSSINIETQERLVSELRKTTEAETEYHRAEILRIRNEQDKLSKKKDGLVDLLIDKSITKDVYDKKLQDIHDRQMILEIESEEHYKADTDYKTTIGTVFSLARRASELFQSSEVEEKRQLLSYFIQNPTLNQKTLCYTMRNPFNLILQLDNRTIRGHLLFEFRTLNWGKIQSEYQMMLKGIEIQCA